MFKYMYKLVNVDLSKIYNWYCFNKLLINFTKTKYMLLMITKQLT